MRGPFGAAMLKPRNDGLPATSRFSGSGVGLFGGRGTASVERSLNAMGSTGTLFGIVSRIAQATASTEWCLYKTSSDNRRSYATTPRPRQEVMKHPALQVWNNPNPFMSRQQFVETFSQHMELVGESEWFVSEHDLVKMPAELWPVRPDRIDPVPSQKEFIAGWVYRTPDGERIPLTTAEVIQLKAPNPVDPYRGMGPVQTLLHDLDSLKYSAQWNANFFANGAIPGGIVEVPNSLDDDEFKEFNARWRESHQGVQNAHRVAMLENGMKWVDVNYSQKDMQFVELSGVSTAKVREAFGMSKTMLGQSEDVNRATAEAAEYVFGKWLLEPRLDRIKGALNNNFLPLFGPMGEGYEFDYISPVPEDLDREASERTSKVAAAVALVNAGWNDKEVLEAMGLPPMTFREKVNNGIPATQGSPADPQEDPVAAYFNEGFHWHSE